MALQRPAAATSWRSVQLFFFLNSIFHLVRHSFKFVLVGG
jgi:hypothetical protein